MTAWESEVDGSNVRVKMTSAVTLTPEQARQLAASLLLCAEVAEQGPDALESDGEESGAGRG